MTLASARGAAGTRGVGAGAVGVIDCLDQFHPRAQIRRGQRQPESNLRCRASSVLMRLISALQFRACLQGLNA
jgi:hypothetical protein